MCVRHRARADLACISWRCFLTIGTLSELSRLGVLRSNHAQPPRTSAPRGGACRFLPPLRIHYHPAFPVATAPKICSTFAVCVSISIFATVCAVVLLPSMFPSHESFLLVCSHHGVGTVVPIFWAARARILILIKLPNRSSGSKNRHDSHAKLENAPRDFRVDFGLRQLRRAGLARRINCWDPGQQGIVHRTRPGLP
jgi:hypothetical protein